MKKCEVLTDTALAVLKGSIVLVNDKQYELARRVLKPVEEKVVKEEKVQELPKKETRKKKIEAE